jgi:hypothetical protein
MGLYINVHEVPRLLIATRRRGKGVAGEFQLTISRQFGESIEWLLTGEDAPLRE